MLGADVEILHQIITTAQQSPNVDTLPFRALFAAYDQVLAQHGLDPDHDQIYLRFLFRLGDEREPGQSLFGAFEALLADLGIRILFGEEDDATEDPGEKGGPSLQESQVFENPEPPVRRSRRASFSSFIDADEENTRASRRRAESRASLSRLQNSARAHQKSRSSTRPTTRPSETLRLGDRHQRRDAKSRPNIPSPGRGRLTSKEFRDNLSYYQRRHASTSSQGSRAAHLSSSNCASIPKARRGGRLASSRDSFIPDFEGSGTLDNTQSSQMSRRSDRAYKDSAREILYRPSETQLLRDSEVFQSFRIRAVARDAIQTWRNLAVKVGCEHVVMEQRAIAHDSDILLRQAFDQWHNSYFLRRQTIETERFFGHLERRANRARDLYLLTKAFTHWAECASEEVQRTSVARRHILRTRYFNAWLEITAVNELKVRRRSLRKFFFLWQHKLRSVGANSTKALSVFSENIVQTIFWRWFWNFCEQRAPEWRKARLKKQFLTRWLAATNADAKLNVQIILSHEEKIMRRYWTHWREKTKKLLALRHHAEYYYSRAIIKRIFGACQLHLRHLPPARRVCSMVDWRVVYTTFSTLRLRVAFEQRAAQVDRQRIIRKAWTQWNDRVRWQTLSQQIDERLVLQALYKWVLAERLVLLRRLYEERLERRAIFKLKEKWEDIYAHREEQCTLVTNTRNRRLLQALTQHWSARIKEHHQRDRLSFEFHAPHVAQETLQVWRSKYKQCAELNTWSRDAAFYFRASRTFKVLQNAVVESQKQKRRAAYAEVRRQVKMNLARRVISRWYSQAAQINDFQEQAHAYYQQTLLELGSGLFHRWLGKLDQALQQNLLVNGQFLKNLRNGCLQVWLDRSRLQQAAEEKADDFAMSHVEKIAYECLRSLRIRGLELGSRSEAATALGQWNRKRHLRNLVRIWREKTSERRGLAEPNFPRTTRSWRTAMGSAVDQTVPFPRQVTDLKDDFDLAELIPALEAQSSNTPLPGYLSTPSKRAARARALTRALPTPTTPSIFGTPLPRRLRMQPATESRLSRRTELGTQDFGRSLGGLR